MEGQEKEILFVDDYESHKESASHIEPNLFDLKVTVSHRMEESSKKELKAINLECQRWLE